MDNWQQQQEQDEREMWEAHTEKLIDLVARVGLTQSDWFVFTREELRDMLEPVKAYLKDELKRHYNR